MESSIPVFAFNTNQFSFELEINKYQASQEYNIPRNCRNKSTLDVKASASRVRIRAAVREGQRSSRKLHQETKAHNHPYYDRCVVSSATEIKVKLKRTNLFGHVAATSNQAKLRKTNLFGHVTATSNQAKLRRPNLFGHVAATSNQACDERLLTRADPNCTFQDVVMRGNDTTDISENVRVPDELKFVSEIVPANEVKVREHVPGRSGLFCMSGKERGDPVVEILNMPFQEMAIDDHLSRKRDNPRPKAEDFKSPRSICSRKSVDITYRCMSEEATYTCEDYPTDITLDKEEPMNSETSLFSHDFGNDVVMVDVSVPIQNEEIFKEAMECEALPCSKYHENDVVMVDAYSNII